MKRPLALTVCLALAVAVTLSLGALPALGRAAAPATKRNAAPVELAPIGALKQEHVGQTFEVQARVIDVTRPSRTLEFVLDDGTGKITLRVSDGVYKAMQNRAGLDYGAKVQVMVRVGFDAEGLYLQALSGRSFTVLSPGSNRQVASRPINALRKAGNVTAIDGTILSAAPSGSSLYLVVANKTGSIRVKLTQSVRLYAPPVTRLVPGARIRVVGPIKYSRGPLVEPVLGYNVTLE